MIDLSEYRTQIESALAYSGGTHTFEDVVQGVTEGRMQAWINKDSIAITEIIVFPRKKTLHGFLAAGNMRRILEMVPSAAEWGRQMGCTAFTLAGRKGWQRVFGRRGWKTAFYVLETEL
jgi:hypothetical protein